MKNNFLKSKLFNIKFQAKTFCNKTSSAAKNPIPFYKINKKNQKDGISNNKKDFTYNDMKTFEDHQKEYEERMNPNKGESNRTDVDFDELDKIDFEKFKYKYMKNKTYLRITYSWQKSLLRSKRLKANNKLNFEKFVRNLFLILKLYITLFSFFLAKSRN